MREVYLFPGGFGFFYKFFKLFRYQVDSLKINSYRMKLLFEESEREVIMCIDDKNLLVDMCLR